MRPNAKIMPPAPARLLRGGFGGLMAEDPSTLSISIRPMEELYTYQAVSLSNAFSYLRSNGSARLRVDLADLEFDMQRGLGFLPYSRDGRSQAAEDRIRELVDLSGSLESSMPQRIMVRRFSSWLGEDKGLLDHMGKLFEKKRAREAKLLISRKTGKNTHLPVAPICPECGHSSATFGVISSDRTRLEGSCRFPDCSGFGKPFSVDVRAPGSVCFFYLFDSAADGYDAPGFGRTMTHVMGIDPERRWGSGKPLYEVVSRLTALLTEDDYSPSYYFAMRLDELASLSKRSRFDDFLSRSGLSKLAALERFCDLASAFDGRTHATLEGLSGRP